MLGRRQRQDLDLPWHADFRDVATLPDVSPVRIGMALNIVGAAILLGACLYTGRQEFEIYTLHQDNNRWRESADATREANNEILTAGRAFDAAAAKAAEVAGFVGAGLPAADLLLDVAGAVGSDVQLVALAVSPQGITVRGTVNGAVADAAVLADAFARRLAEVPGLAARFPRVELEQVSPIGTEAGVSFVIQLRPPAPAPANQARPAAPQDNPEG